MTNLIQQKTASATDAQPAGAPHQPSSRETFVKGIARPLRTTEAATYVGLSPRTMEKHRTYGTGPVYQKLGNRVVYAIEDSMFGPRRESDAHRPTREWARSFLPSEEPHVADYVSLPMIDEKSAVGST